MMRRSLVLLLVPLLASCKLEPSFERASPYDSSGIFDLSIAGPDSAHHLGATVRLSVATAPPLPDDEFHLFWLARPHSECLPKHNPNCMNLPVDLVIASGAGLGADFTVINATAEYRRIVVGARFGRVELGKELLVGQKVATMALSCSPWSAPEDPCDAPFGPDAAILLHTRLRDVINDDVRRVEYAIDRATVTVRDPAVAARVPPGLELAGIVRLTAMNPGSTWVVVNIDEAVDSVRVTVMP